MAQQKVYLNWNYDSIIWGSNDYIWSEVYILIDIAVSGGGAGGGLLLHKNQPWKDLEKHLHDKKYTKNDTRKLLELVVRVNGLVKTEVREINDLKKSITIDHIKNTLATVVPNIQVTVAEIKKS